MRLSQNFPPARVPFWMIALFFESFPERLSPQFRISDIHSSINAEKSSVHTGFLSLLKTNK